MTRGKTVEHRYDLASMKRELTGLMNRE